MSIEFELNGENESVEADGSVPMLYVLRNDLGLNGPKFGCGLGQCGACTVLLDDTPVRSCLLQVSAAAGRRVTTLEGIGDRDNPHPLQTAFLEEQALQCGYCGNGVIMAATALLKNNPRPSDKEIRDALQGHLCRCGVQGRMVTAISRAAGSNGESA
jgi:nicotinate dehydrogenase subunit A